MSYPDSFADDFLDEGAEKRFANSRQQYLDDLRKVLATPEGFRLIVAMMKNMGFASYVSCNEGMVALHNEAPG